MAAKKKTTAKARKVSSPTGRPSKVNPDVAAAMAGKGGKRPPKPKAPKKSGSKNVTEGGMVRGKRARKKYLDEI